MLTRGAGDLGTGVAHRLYRAGFEVYMTELPEPLAVRCTAAFSESVFRGRWCVEGVWAARVDTAEEALRLVGVERGVIPLIVDPEGRSRLVLEPAVLVDARMAKRNLGTTRQDARVVVGLGPGFTAGEDVHAVVETARGHHLGRVIYRGRAQEDTGVPGNVGGFTQERVLRAPAAGTLRTLVGLGDRVEAGQVVAEVVPERVAGVAGDLVPVAGVGADLVPDVSPATSPGEEAVVAVRAAIAGVVRGLLRDGAPVRAGQKVGDMDPRTDPSAIWYISDKARAVAGGVLEAVSCLLWGRPPV